MHSRPRPFDIVHVSSAHPWTDNRIHSRAAATAARAGYRTALVAVVASAHLGDTDRADADWDRPDAQTGVWIRRLPRRRRSGRLILSTVQAVRAALSSRARVVHLHDPELVWAIPLLRLARRWVVYDAHEDLPAQVIGKEYLGRLRTVAVPVAGLVVRIAAHADAVIAATPTIARRFPADRTAVVKNLPVLRASDDALVDASGRSPVAVYLGALSHDRGIDVISGVAGSPALPSGWQLCTAGPIDGAVDRRAFDACCAAGQIDHRGVLPPDRARDLLQTARVGLLPLLPTGAYATSIPTKLFEYLAAGLAVIATDVPYWRELLADAECVSWVPAGDPDAVVRALQRYATDPDLLDEHARAGRRMVDERFRWDREAPELLRVYRRLWGVSPAEESVRSAATGSSTADRNVVCE